ncbi:PREDICTED: uncharacterized protein LOC109339276 isoform X2 [Lupinus angustifolius]|uniref:uncharacterized protein LOC109339276 isoform X2 n=1 Tax=Lupinus angustifolius TaxID=3871 RepID=UPI00092E62A2|nr:PREDICTED: uncharacterized protein LOC109339276 isoform X2 [Lupinus angustifolius]
MTEFSSLSTQKNEFSVHFFSNLLSFCFNMFSHPLYFSYFIFFSSYIFKLLSFLSPLFITTTLLFVALLIGTFTPNLVTQEKPSSTSHSYDSKYGFVVSVFQTFMSWVLSEADEKDEEVGYLDELEAYLVMFQASIFEVFEPKSVEDCSVVFEETNAEFSDEKREDFCSTEDANITNSVKKPVQKVDENVEATNPISEVKSIESLFQENAEELEDFCSIEKQVQKVDENVEATKSIAEVKSLESLFQENVEELEDKGVKKLDPESNKVEESEEKWSLRSGSNKVKGYNRDIYANNKVKSQRSLDSNYYLGSPESNLDYSGRVTNQSLCSSNLGSFGSMRVEKEWRRTLACKLFEERHNNGDGSDGGMDMLWETYETESNKVLKKSNTKKGKKGEIEYYEDDEEEEEEEEFEEGKLCCLQALKFSAGKMNLGMRRPNLLKFSKALKGIGWLHHVGKNGKKVQPMK